MQGSLEVFDDRRCALGEGPVSLGTNHTEITWVDVWGKSLLTKNMDSGASSLFTIDEDLSFAIPTEGGNQLLGSARGPLLMQGNQLSQFVTRDEIDATPMRWNDAKVSPHGDLWLGTLSYNEEPGFAGLYQLRASDHELVKVISDVGMSNGMAWSADASKFYWIDTLSFGLDAFDYDQSGIHNRRQVIAFDTVFGYPDGMTIDNEDGLWIAFYAGGAVRRFDTRNGFKQTHEIKVPASRTTSCTFAGPALNKLIITTAHKNEAGTSAEDGRTYICEPGFTGTPTRYFAGA